MALSSDRLVRCLDVLTEAATAHEIADFAQQVVPNLLTVVPGDSAAYCEFLPADGRPGHVLVSVGESVTDGMYECLITHQGDDPWMRHARHTGDLTVRRWSDHTTRRALDDNPLYHGLYRPVHTRYGLAIPLEWTTTHVRALFIGRTTSDFSDDDRGAAELLRPRLAKLAARLIHSQREKTSGTTPSEATLTALCRPNSNIRGEIPENADDQKLLTSRQHEVAELLSRGLANKQIATELRISPRTVKKHVEAIFRSLDVYNRVTAAQRYRQLRSD
ncbi:response regulator transcription factor [Amycolatopsis sp. cmx-4-61]|uniref:response regulator transcription factor n=1 Tax=Amycolatopsis sp. cmx-4-61 TaxID=2790937 RepID=UPI00397E22FA